MIHFHHTKKILLFSLLSISSHILIAQDLGNIKQAKPVKFSGNIGASASYYNSNESYKSRPPYSWNLYGNLTPTVYGISLPVSFTISQYGKSYTQPFSQFGLSPTYKWIKLHVGYRYMQFSPLTYDGQSFRGAGLELTPKHFRFAAFYGKLNKKVNEDTTSGRFALPQFSRKGYGVKIGVGNYSNYFDLIYLHAKDDSGSAKVINKQKIAAMENTTVGTALRLTLIKKIILTNDFAISGLTRDIADTTKARDTASFFSNLMNKLNKTNTSIVTDWATQSMLQFILKGYTTTIGYRMVRPGFKSLGTPYMLNDVELINWLNNFSLEKGRVNITAMLSSQHNNLDKKLASEIKTRTGTMNTSAVMSQHFSLNLNYTGYLIQQADGLQKLTDSTRLNQVIHQLSITPLYTSTLNGRSNSISSNISYMILNDKNPQTKNYTNSNNLSASLNYTLGLVKKAMNFTLGGLYNQYSQDTNYYRSYGGTFTTAAQVLKNKSLSLQGSVGYILNKSSYGNSRNNLTFSSNIGYHIKRHSLNAYANFIYTPYNPINNIIYKQVPQAVATKNVGGGILYNYSF